MKIDFLGMASSNISKKEVRKKLEESLKNFDWLNEFFPHSNKFILEYKLYHAQLREGDKLEINVSKSENSKNGIPYAEPFLEIILLQKPAQMCGKSLFNTNNNE